MKEEKELLLNDLCARLSYGTIGLYSWKNREPYNRELTGSIFDELKSSWDSTEDSQFLPYLRPMSSMTEEEKKEYEKFCELDTEILANHPMNGEPFPALYNSQDWLNSYHFDYRGLIEKGLAIEVTEDNNPYKD